MGFMSQEEVMKGKFLFVSYSHREMDMVFNDVQALHQKSVRLYFLCREAREDERMEKNTRS